MKYSMSKFLITNCFTQKILYALLKYRHSYNLKFFGKYILNTSYIVGLEREFYLNNFLIKVFISLEKPPEIDLYLPSHIFKANY